MDRSDLRVIVGGAAPERAGSSAEKEFVCAYVTDTRLMGVLVLYMQWKTPVGSYILNEKNETLHQFFYVESTEAGIESYRGLITDDEDMLDELEQIMLGGLGGARVPLTETEALYLFGKYAQYNKRFNNPLPDDTNEYAFVMEKAKGELNVNDEELFRRTCGKLDTENQLINYFLMRYFARDFNPVDMMSNVDISRNLIRNNGSAVLCLNNIERIDEDGQLSYLCESVLEDDKGHRIVVTDLVVTDMAVDGMSIISEFEISSAEAAMKLSRPEFVTAFELDGNIDPAIMYLDTKYRGSLQNETMGGKLYVKFTSDNSHVKNDIYRLNDDVEEILYVTVEGQLVVGAYTIERIQTLEYKIYKMPIGEDIVPLGSFEFKEPILYDYTLSEGGDFLTYIRDVMRPQ